MGQLQHRATDIVEEEQEEVDGIQGSERRGEGRAAKARD